MSWNDIIPVLSLLLSGGLFALVSIREKKRQETEKTKQAQEQTKQDSLETSMKNFEHLKERVEFAEGNIHTLHERMFEMQNTINDLTPRVLFAENRICLKVECTEREPAIGHFKPKKCKNDVQA